MRKVKRSRTEQTYAVLNTLVKPVIISDVMYRTNINCDSLKRILLDLEKAGYVAQKHSVAKATLGKHRYRQEYVLTDAGRFVLSQCRIAFDLLDFRVARNEAVLARRCVEQGDLKV